ncbi:hypothetical protein jhhlp_002560 [Lomentospora prolificans]|uniref:Spindle pole body component n=1 Tax=Lomentospora prolificans TaxID=41688 RepID=A0A2N3NEF3_9PEZI|nr:hypothetical protein jhhlp_002560 [Lomentospora prolificans]
MAFQAQLFSFTSELVEAITGTSSMLPFFGLSSDIQILTRDTQSQPEKFSKYRDRTLRRLRNHNFLRTNQFEVEKTLNGLEETFRVHHREALADALRERLDALDPVPEKWRPDFLHLLLELSDRPLQNTNLDDLDALRPPTRQPQPQLRWEDIAKEDGWADEPDLWASIDYSDSDAGVDEEYLSDSGSDGHSSASDQLSGSSRVAKDFVLEPQDHSTLEALKEAQKWRVHQPLRPSEAGRRKVAISELQVLREALSMLRGQSTTLFSEDYAPNVTYQLSDVSMDTYQSLIDGLAETGRRLGILRAFCMRPQSASHIQVFQDCVTRNLYSFDTHVTNIESRLIQLHQDTIISLVAALNELKTPLEPLYKLSDILRQLEESNQGAFRYLELLFQEIGVAQVSGRRTTYEVLGRIFFECFRFYLRPMRLWMQEGELIPGDKIFFVSESATYVPLNQVWRDQFRVKRTADGSLYAPKFLSPSAGKIFIAGKSIVILKHLGKYSSVQNGLGQENEPTFDFDSMFASASDLAPFTELFNASFDRWVRSKHHATALGLKKVLFESCGLWADLEVMQLLYFMADGSLADSFCTSIFKKLDMLSAAWRDRYALTSLAQEAYSPNVPHHRLSVTIGQRGQRVPAITARDFVRKLLPEISLIYNVRWPVQMILAEESVIRYKSVFTLLLQLRRANYMLKKHRILANDATDGENWDDRSVYYLVRSKLLWFCNTLQSYLTSLVLLPNCEKLRADLESSQDVDAMTEVHLAFTKRVLDECCLGSKLEPIREGILDIVDLTIQLEKAYVLNARRESEEMQEISRLSIITSPPRPSLTSTPSRGLKTPRRGVDSSDDDDEDDEDAHIDHDGHGRHDVRSFKETVLTLHSSFDKHLRFVTEGLRAVARATGDTAASKWYILAEMLETGITGARFQSWM